MAHPAVAGGAFAGQGRPPLRPPLELRDGRPNVRVARGEGFSGRG